MRTTSRFDKPGDRNAAARDELASLEAASGNVPPLAAAEAAMVDALLGPLRADPPTRSAAAEAALVILIITLAEGRPLNVVDPAAGDISEGSRRLEGDRTLSEELSAWLGRRNIPATQGALQSNTYRSGYVAGQAQSSALTEFVRWLSNPARTMGEVTDVAAAVTAGFLSNAVTLPPLPRLRRSRLTAVKFRAITEALFSQGSHGAFEQYLVAGVLRAETVATGRTVRVETKSAKVSDHASGASGDVELRQGQALLEAIEVTAGDWRTKLPQLAAGGRGVAAITVVARGVQATSADTFAHELAQDPRLGATDVRCVELMGLIDLCSSRLDGGGRADALTFVYECLARWHRSEPGLIQRLVGAVESAGVVERDARPEATLDDVETAEQADAVAQRLVRRLQQGNFLADENVLADLKRLQELSPLDPPSVS